MCSNECVKINNDMNKALNNHKYAYTPDDIIGSVKNIFSLADKYIRIDHDYSVLDHEKKMERFTNTMKDKLYEFYFLVLDKEIQAFNHSNRPEFYYKQLTDMCLTYLEEIFYIKFCSSSTHEGERCRRKKITDKKKWVCVQHTKRNKKLMKTLNPYLIKDLSNIIVEYC